MTRLGTWAFVAGLALLAPVDLRAACDLSAADCAARRLEDCEARLSGDAAAFAACLEECEICPDGEICVDGACCPTRRACASLDRCCAPGERCSRDGECVADGPQTSDGGETPSTVLPGGDRRVATPP